MKGVTIMFKLIECFIPYTDARSDLHLRTGMRVPPITVILK